MDYSKNRLNLEQFLVHTYIVDPIIELSDAMIGKQFFFRATAEKVGAAIALPQKLYVYLECGASALPPAEEVAVSAYLGVLFSQSEAIALFFQDLEPRRVARRRMKEAI